MNSENNLLPLPEKLLASLKDVQGYDESSFRSVHGSGEQVVSLRINPKKNDQGLPGLINPALKVPWSSTGYYLEERPFFTFDPLLHAGAYYVQEASSMFLEQVIKTSRDLNQPLKALDLCAAPGGKSTLIQAMITRDSLLVSNEVIRSRVPVLTENLVKWGSPNAVITNNDPQDFSRLPAYFDLMVVDAPCSGSGLFRKDPSAIAEWTEEAVEQCSLRQKRILSAALPAQASNGLLVYSTCSYSLEEDEGIADWLVRDFGLEPLRIPVEAQWNIVE
ncbi:MAG TPA: RsmB/NOP family class I SAM-dependent RNA methyltransferase, partial [Flavitalea sp.]|nr:RsmB/NOP family class I SAM-dependent RNA methyltransferase [Flavitalea sp.]